MADRHHPLERMLDADRQLDGDDAEAVAELDVAGLAQVDRHQGPAFHPLGLVAAVGKVAPHRAGDAGEQKVVDRTSERPADRLDLGQLDRLAPGDALRPFRFALESRRAVARHEKQIGEFARDARAVAQEAGRAQRIAGQAERRLHSRARRPGARIDRRDDRRHHTLQPALLLVLSRCGARSALGPVDELHRDVHQRHAVGDRVVHAEDHRSAALVSVDEVHRPERMVGIERLGGEFAGEAFECMFAAAPRQADTSDMMAEVEIGVVAPKDRGGRALDHLTIATVAEQAFDDLGLDPLDVDRPFQHPDADDHHQVVGTVHTQPRRVDRGHALPTAHRFLPFPSSF